MKIDTINKTIEKYGNDREHTMLILRELETKSGANVLDTQTLRHVAEAMNLPESAMAGFVEFYTMFKTKPRAKFVIRVCKSGPCHVMGSKTIFDAVTKKLGIGIGEATKDGLFYLEKCECLGVCSVAPAMMINYDIHGNLTPKRIGQILDSYKKKKPSLSEDCGPEVEGKACVINEKKQTKRLLEGVGVVDPLKIDSYIKEGGYSPLKKALGMSRDEIIAVMKDSGLRGRGGAGFPAGMKWSFVTKGAMQKYVICNADEGEPGTFKDRILMEENPQLLIEGMAICGYAIDASIGYIYIRGEYRRSIERLQKAIDQARNKGLLGKNINGSGFNYDVFIKEGGGAYVCGEETSLINSMEGLRGYPRFKPPFPGGAGFNMLPSNVNNVETLMSVPMIIDKGAAWYKSVGTVNCSGTKLYCLSGKLNRTGLVELPMGTTLKEIIDVYGKGLKGGKKFKFAQLGGSAAGVLGKDLLNLPLDIDQPIKQGVTLGSGVVLVCDEDTCSVDFLLQILSFFEHESCGQCVPCRVGTAHLHHLVKKFASRTAEPADIDLMIEKATLMKKASLCALGQSPIMPIVTTLKYFRKEFEKHCDPSYKCKACDASLKTYYTGSAH
ncbi:MAG: NADH-quinone oxidoreductase subunit NuoF [Spirochaetae bacterium HGW-Spirochaetae-1]|jgi:NADH-quinone oxidoreductase subunit F|nr:MAG: NADH-quinone oxidoreductase subunit NuoF [Spirochaetae bacterium HGW-Spirochaetae-1]